MKRLFFLLIAAGALLLAGCSKAEAPQAGEAKVKGPRAVASLLTYDFGDVPVVTDMSQGKTKSFAIKNEGTEDLKLSNVQVKLLQGC